MRLPYSLPFVPTFLLLALFSLAGCQLDTSVESLRIDPSAATVAVDESVTLNAILTRSGVEAPATDAVWTSASPTIATVTMGTDGSAVVRGVRGGRAIITATRGELTATATIEVSTVSLTSLAITPNMPSIAAGTTVALTATGTFSDGTTRDLTSGLSWFTSAEPVAVVAGTGVVTGVSPGTVTITARMGSVSGTAMVTVTDATLESISVTPSAPTLAAGFDQALVATGTFSDGSNQNLTTQVTWSSSNEAAASVSNATGSEGTVTGVAAGSAVITATLDGISGTATVTVTAATLLSIEVAPATVTLAAGLTQALTATGTFSDGTNADLTTTATWASSNASIASVSSAAGTEGVVTAITTGATDVTATFGGITGTATITVSDADLVSLEVSPLDPSVARGFDQSFTATGTFTDGSTRDVTTSVTWSVDDESIATISNAAGTEGVASAVAVGVANVTASLFGESASTTLTVTDAVLVSLGITPVDASLARGLTLPLTATGVFSDGSNGDLTALVTWASDAPSVASVSNAAGSEGTATALTVGTANISATLGTVSASTTLTVTAASLVSIEITPPDPSAPRGRTQQFTATGVFTDGSTTTLTTAVTWSSDAIGIATISNAAGSEGLASAVDLGTVDITATLGTVSATTTFTVTSAVLVSLAVTPTNPSVARGRTQQFTATGTFSDGSTRDLTATVTWSSMGTAATVSNATGTQGLATGANVGSSTITATSGSISASTTLTVTSAVLVSIAVTPTNPSVARGRTQQFTATGTFSDGTFSDLTETVTWASSSTATATISNAVGSRGLASGANVGSTTITATSGAISGSTSLTVTSAVLVSLAVTPTNPSIARGRTQQFTATGTFSDASVSDLTSSVTWSSSSTATATISNAVGTQGLATGANVGSTTITATSGSVSGNTTLTVTSAVLVSIDVTPAMPSIARGRTQQFTATGTFSDASVMDLTSTVTWASSSTATATISNAAGTEGLSTGTNVGATTISATSGSISGSTTLTVTAATLVSIAVTPASPSIALGLTQPFTATGTFTDGSTMDLTDTATWTSSSTATATISNAAGSHGLATSVATGSTTISATSGAISGTATLTVSPATLVSIAVTPVSPSLPVGMTQAFVAMGTYSNGVVTDLTTQVTWASSNSSAATVSNAAGSEGTATAVAVGSTTVSATFGTVSGSTTLTVTSAVLTSIAITPATSSRPSGTTQAFTALGTLSDGSTQDVTTTATWSSSDTAVAVISNASGSEGLATTLSAGSSTISATVGTISGSASLTVTTPVAVSLSVTPDSTTLNIGQTVQYTAIVTLDNGMTMDVTATTTWGSSTTAATIDAAGLATAVSGGSSTITGTFGTVSDTGSLTVNAVAPTVVSTSPAAGAVNVALPATLSVTFSTAMSAASLTTQSVAGACSGSLQVSNDNFASCIRLSAVTLSGGDTIASFTAAPGLAYGTTYAIRVTTGAQSAASTALASTFTQSSGFTTAVDVAAPAGLVISQIYGGGGGSGATYRNDFIELHNASGAPISLSGMAVQYASSAGTTWNVTTLSAVTLPAGAYYLVQQASSGAVGAMLPTADATGTISMSATAGKVALTTTATPLTGSCPTGASIIDFVGFGTANCFEGTGAAPSPSTTTAVVRARSGCLDANQNGTDFTTATPSPRNTSSTVVVCSATANETSAGREADYCAIQFPTSLSVTTGAVTPLVYARIFEAGTTEPAGASSAVRAEIGYGPLGVNPEYESGYVWTSATFNTQVGNDDEYQASFTAPAAGSYTFGARFTLDGTNWTYCDLDGAGSNPGLSFDPTDLGPFTVTP